MTPISRAAVDAAIQSERCEAYYEDDGCDGPFGCGECQRLIREAVTPLLLADADAAETSGPWFCRKSSMGDYWVVEHRTSRVVHGPFTEAESVGVRNLLNRVAARATTEGER